MADQERPICGAHDNDNPYIECALPLGHDGPHSDRADTKQAATCPSCGLTKYGFDVKEYQETWAMLGALIREAVEGRGPDFERRWQAVQDRLKLCPDPFHDEVPAHPVSADEWWTIWVCDECGTITEWEETEGKPLCDGASIEVEGGGYLTEEEAEQDHKWTPMRRIVVVPEARAAEAERVLRDVASDLAEARLHHEQGKWSDQAHRDGLERTEAKARAALTPKHPQDEESGG